MNSTAIIRNILIIDDDRIFSKVLKDALTSVDSAKYHIDSAYDGEEGLKRVKKEKPDLIILDLMMPKIGGIDFLKQLKKIYGTIKIPILISSQISDIEKISEGMELGIVGYILKSDYSLDSIIKQVEEILNGK